MSALDDVCRLAATYFDRHQEWPGELRIDAPRLHALVRELSATDLQRICLLVRLRTRRTPGASVGGRSVIELAEAETAPAEAKHLAAQWLGTVPLERRDAVNFDRAFLPRPGSWGLRGDPHLWDALRRHFTGRPVPADTLEAEAVLHYAIREITGHDLRIAEQQVPVPAFAVGHGMSDGFIDASFWLEQAIPLLLGRASELSRN